MAIDVARDGDGLRQALGELLEESFVLSRVRRSIAASDDEGGDRIFGTVPPRTLSPGYYKLGEYLMWLEERLQFFRDFAAFEADGITLLTQARHEFERKHPPCGACGAFQDTPWATSCHACGIEFAMRKAG